MALTSARARSRPRSRNQRLARLARGCERLHYRLCHPHADSLSAAAHSGLKQHRGLESALSAKPAHSCACASSRHRSPFARVGRRVRRQEPTARPHELDHDDALRASGSRSKPQAPPQIFPDALGMSAAGRVRWHGAGTDSLVAAAVVSASLRTPVLFASGRPLAQARCRGRRSRSGMKRHSRSA